MAGYAGKPHRCRRPAGRSALGAAIAVLAFRTIVPSSSCWCFKLRCARFSKIQSGVWMVRIRGSGTFAIWLVVAVLASVGCGSEAAVSTQPSLKLADRCDQFHGPAPGCCTESGECGYLTKGGSCAGPKPNQARLANLAALPESRACDGRYQCQNTSCAATPQGTEPCCLSDPGTSLWLSVCGLSYAQHSGAKRVLDGLGPGRAPAYSPLGCMLPDMLHRDCPGGCCTPDGYCGWPSLDGRTCLLDPTDHTTDCGGQPRPFSCGGQACLAAPAGQLGKRPRCCTSDGGCGLMFENGCVSLGEFDADCPAPQGKLGCCASDQVCSVWDDQNLVCPPHPDPSSPRRRDCDGRLIGGCVPGACEPPWHSPSDPPHVTCCLPRTDACGIDIGGGRCVSASLVSRLCPRAPDGTLGCCETEGSLCGHFDAAGQCIVPPGARLLCILVP